MAKLKPPPGANDAEVQALLERYRCPLPFHAVRTRFLGAIASPGPQASPITAMKSIWGGNLPTFATVAAANEVFGALGMGLWNRLTRHQDRLASFHLTRIDVPATREGLIRLALVREQELANFRDGLFGDNFSLDLPERAHKAVGVLSEIRGIMQGTRELVENPDKPVTSDALADLLKQYRELTRIAEVEIHEAVLSCTRARRNMRPDMPPANTTRH